MKLHDYKQLAEEEKFKQILMANFGEYKVFRSPYISHTDFLHQHLIFLFLLPTSHVVGLPLEFLVTGIKYVAFWSKTEGQ